MRAYGDAVQEICEELVVKIKPQLKRAGDIILRTVPPVTIIDVS